MPYINREQRDQLDPPIALIVKSLLYSGYGVDKETLAGHLNYVITRLLLETLPCPENCHYVDLRDALGTIEAVKLEFYRRKVAPYEDKKARENGDVYAA